jgi:hypothetical protein
MSDDVRQRARAQYFGPEMLRVIARSVSRLDEEIREARGMEVADVAALLRNIQEPLSAIHDRVTAEDDDL